MRAGHVRFGWSKNDGTYLVVSEQLIVLAKVLLLAIYSAAGQEIIDNVSLCLLRGDGLGRCAVGDAFLVALRLVVLGELSLGREEDCKVFQLLIRLRLLGVILLFDRLDIGISMCHGWW